MGLGVAVEFARVNTVRVLPFDGAESLSAESLTRALDGGAATVQRVSDFRITPSLIGLQQDTCSGGFLRTVVAG
jgi:hypothetical protein